MQIRSRRSGLGRGRGPPLLDSDVFEPGYFACGVERLHRQGQQQNAELPGRWLRCHWRRRVSHVCMPTGIEPVADRKDDWTPAT